MPDISMCATDECPLRSKCYRHQASGTQPSEGRQSWVRFCWRNQHDTGIYCDGYWPRPAAVPPSAPSRPEPKESR